MAADQLITTWLLMMLSAQPIFNIGEPEDNPGHYFQPKNLIRNGNLEKYIP